jgi:hypothetical protein
VRDANLFHTGFVLAGDLGARWTHQTIADIQLYRNQNQIQLSTTAAGFPVLINNSVGFSLSGPIPTLGNAVTTPGGAVYTAARYQVARVAYRLTNRGVRIGTRDMPFYFDIQALRNVGTHQLRDAMMASFNFGAVRQLGDVRFLYQYSIKDANSMIAQFTDDDLGTGSTTNIAVHALRFDLRLDAVISMAKPLFHPEREARQAIQRNSSLFRCSAAPTRRIDTWASWRSPSEIQLTAR